MSPEMLTAASLTRVPTGTAQSTRDVREYLACDEASSASLSEDRSLEDGIPLLFFLP